MDLGITDRVALVVGGTGYLGRHIATTLAAEGAVVVTAGRSGGDVTIDGQDEASVVAGVDEVIAGHGRIDILVVTAAPAAQTLDPADAFSPAAVAAAVDAKSLVFLRLANAVLPHMRARGSGRIIGIAGQLARSSTSVVASVRNAALILAAKALADSVAGTGVTVNVVNPGNVFDDEHPVPAIGPGPSTPEQIAALVAYLSSEPAAAVSGASIATGHTFRGVSAL
jgi:NAD(P)-dependent dehydrogenase (short-subunit alcohol dehydrogenase family)